MHKYLFGIGNKNNTLLVQKNQKLCILCTIQNK